MVMRKDEMEGAYNEYHARMARAREGVRDGLYRRAVEDALEAWPFIDGMMQYGRKYAQEEFDSIAAIDLVLKYVPLLLDSKQLDFLETLLKKYRRIERDTAADIGEQLSKARSRMWAAYRLWDHIERHPDARQAELRSALGGEQKEWAEIITTWEKMGLIQRMQEGNSYRVVFRTRMGEIISGKCPECGVVTQAPKAMLLEELTCPDCRKKAAFVLLGADAPGA